jgi:hypothetical protein
VPAGFSTVIKQLVVTNTTGSAATFTFYIGDAVAGNALFSATSVGANDTVIINLSQVLQSNEVLRALASANSTLNLTVSGVENDGPLEPSANFIANDSVTVNKIADGSVTSAKIADGTIVNTDINASAAIAQSKVANLTSDLALKAPIASPTFTGVPLAPTAGVGTNTTQLATTAFANSAGGLVYIASATVTSGTFLRIDNCFTATYDAYRVVLSPFSTNTAVLVSARLLNNSGVVISTEYYYQNQNTPYSATSTYSQQGGSNVATWDNLIIADGGGIGAASAFDIFNPFLTTRTVVIGTRTDARTSGLAGSFVGFHSANESYGGLYFSVSGATFVNATATVYGYRKA